MAGRCPDCSHALEPVELALPRRRTATIQVCTKCEAVFLDATGLEAAFPRFRDVALESLGLETERACPSCSKPMEAMVLKGVPIERCALCFGLFLEASDVAALRGAFPPSTSAARAHQPRSTATTGFTCASCGAQTPYAKGSAMRGVLVCPECVVNPVPLAPGRARHRAWDDSDDLTMGLLELLDFTDS